MQAPFCKDCFTGTLRGDITPIGTEQTVHNVPSYVSLPPDGAQSLGTVVIISDALGWNLRNTRVLADAYARRIPCKVLVPDFNNGTALPEKFLTLTDALPTANILTKIWIYAHLVPPLLRFLLYNRYAVAAPRVNAFFDSLRQELGPSGKIGVAGFCWGGLYTIRLTHLSPPLINCAFTAHPSLVSVPVDIEKVRDDTPLSVANGDDDEYLGRAKMKTVVRLLRDRERHEVVMYEGAKHGFAVRGDIGDPKQKERGEGSEGQAVGWFRRWMS
ncbi:Alpha/Beta hydrolase protein [Triangularia setosa]|uniref:Alpha/Beta hydrolase protein n=1 Tax=Triangularia setosa TaxID=2587417 RepID=A0AAN6VYJ1_9PEZI|nr:Alpha/Beta hydrolase protein [Podospora setosa]